MIDQLESNYCEFLEKSGKSNSYNLAHAWIARQEECECMSAFNRMETAKILSGE